MTHVSSALNERGLFVKSPNLGSETPAAASLHALDRLIAFLAALLSGAGPFVALSLANRGWTPGNIGIVLTGNALAALLSQVPAGELIDNVRSKRIVVGAAAAAFTLGVLLLALRQDFLSVFFAAIVLGASSGFISPAIVAISLGLVGQNGLAKRLGRNQRFASIGGLVAAAIMGIVGYLLSAREILFVTAIFGLPALWALASIRHGDIHYARSCSSCDHDTPHPPRLSRAVLLKDHRLVIFAACLFLFQMANASILPLAGETLAHTDGRWSTLLLSVLIVVPQIIVAVLAPWVGEMADTWGRRPLLLIGLGVVPLRALLFALTGNPELLVIIQVLDGITGAVLGVLTALVIADLARGTGRFNLAQGLVGTWSGIGASVSTAASGLIVTKLGQAAGFLSVAVIGVLSVAILWLFMPETKPSASQLTGEVKS